ncbi:tetratricopeptide repeat protein [Bathymodiolus thermophilus thioautotrophic gill symbiont]|uniref:Uncharacterized protein n=1 Tax=Bathymodiolus thermophilus thioautotrophic gill symbiont TaxID=2360 RepID=A0A1J5U986_9GAMM|nr:tetratricopeptide repeat protein [Bathymodiolus thermophilus thioautotrophic gill symbiont]OIR24953.1 hypothetical protein BGC33_05020 [Bathymodiolus thermophilus thioautotrophic gill symbiont]
MTSKATNLTDKQLIQAIFDALEGSDTRYGFFLGAGASVASDIPAAKELSEKWLEIIDESTSVDTSKWKKDPAKFYSEVFSQRFIANPTAGEDELRRYINKATPSIGYLFLAQILTETKNKFVLTTNFDTMTEDALFSLKNAKPLIIGHESLANYLSVNSSVRPTIVKLHHDCLLSPKNTEEDTQKLPEDFKKNLNPILENTHLIVIGYGGNDTSIMDYLKNNTNRKPIYWCCRDKKTLSTEVKNMLTDKDFIVEIKDFDRFMLMLNDKLGFDPLIDQEDIKNSPLVVNAIKAVENYQKQLEELTKTNELEEDEIEAIKEQLPAWWDYELEVRNESDIDKKDEIYKEGLEACPDSFELHINYAIFLSNIRHDHDKAEIHYKRALKFDSNHVDTNGSYAIFLSNIRNNHDKAEIHYKRALKFDSNHVNANGSYAVFLSNIRNNHDKAEIHYKRALEFNSNNVNINGNYAAFLTHIRKDYNQAERYYMEVLKFDSNNANANGNYAQLLLIQGKNPQAEAYLNKAFEFADNHKDLLAELWFYRLAHYPAYRSEAIKRLDDLLADGAKSRGWDFSENIKQAEKQGFESIELLQEYADKISEAKDA